MTDFLNIGVPLWVALLIFFLGMVGGFMVQAGWYEYHGRRVIVPFIARSSRNITIMAVVLGAVSLATIVQVYVSTSTGQRCDVEFRTALKYNVDLGRSTTKVDERERTAVRNLVLAVADDPAAAPNVAREVAAELLDVMADRAAINAQRAPYPEPTCGN